MKYNIDTDKEITPAHLAKELNHKGTELISMWIIRGRVKFRRIKELNLVLVEKSSVPVKPAVTIANLNEPSKGLTKELKPARTTNVTINTTKKKPFMSEAMKKKMGL